MPRDDSHGDAPVQAAGVPAVKLRAVVSHQGAGGERAYAGIEDGTLVAEALAGQRWAQREVWYRFAPMVHGLLRRSLSSRHDHEDLVQEVFVRVFRRLHTLEKPSALRSFIYSVAVRVVSEEIRRFQVFQRARAQLVVIACDAGNTGADFESREALVRIQNILDGLKDKHRAVFVLRHVEGMDLQEIAEGIGISLATVKRYLVKSIHAIQSAASRDEGLRDMLDSVSSGKTSGGSP